MLTAQKLEFHDRIARIAAGQGSTRAMVFVGQDLTFSYVPRNRRRRAGLAEMVANALHSLSFPLCMALGLASYGLYLYGQWILLGVPNAPESPDLDMAITALATSCITVLLTHVLGLRARALLVLVNGADLMKLGWPAGPELGRVLNDIQTLRTRRFN